MIKGIKIVDVQGIDILIEPIYGEDPENITLEEAEVFSWGFRNRYEGSLVVYRKRQIEILKYDLGIDVSELEKLTDELGLKW